MTPSNMVQGGAEERNDANQRFYRYRAGDAVFICYTSVPMMSSINLGVQSGGSSKGVKYGNADTDIYLLEAARSHS